MLKRARGCFLKALLGCFLFFTGSVLIAQSEGLGLMQVSPGDFEHKTQVEAKTVGQAKKIALERAVRELALEATLELMGPSLFKQNLKSIEQNILKKSYVFIPVVKQEEPIRQNGVFVVLTKLRLEQRALEDLLKETGLLFSKTAEAIFLPLFSCTDNAGQNFFWWREGLPSSPCMELEGLLSKAFFAQGFYTLEPMKNQFFYTLPNRFSESLGSSDKKRLSEVFSAPYLIVGSLNLVKGEISLEVEQAQSGRVLASIIRKLEPVGAGASAIQEKKWQLQLQKSFTEFSEQALDSYKEGSFDAERIQLEIQGGFFAPDIEFLKEGLKKKSRAIRTLKERKLSAQKLVFEMDVGSTGQSGLDQLKADLAGFEFRNKKYKVKEIGPKVLSLVL